MVFAHPVGPPGWISHHQDLEYFLEGSTIRPSKDKKVHFLIAISYLASFIFIRSMVLLAGSVDSAIAQTVEEGSGEVIFHIGRNIILFGYHIHHFYFGMLLIAMAGWFAIVDRSGVDKERLAVIYGAGLGLLMDEIGLLLTWGDYTSSLSYLLGVFILGLFLSVVYFPGFWRNVRSNLGPFNFASPILNKAIKFVIALADRISGRRYKDN